MSPDEQLLLDFDWQATCTLANFAVGRDNRKVIDAIQAIHHANYTSLTLVGDHGTGKTHLLQAVVRAHQLNSGLETANYLDLVSGSETRNLIEQQHQPDEEEGWLSHLLAERASCRLVAVDNLEQLQHTPVWQEGILYLFNQLRTTGGHLLCASQMPLQHLTSVLRSDLGSRLLWGAEMNLEPPAEQELLTILHKMIEDRQIRVETGLPQFLWLRLPRHVHEYTRALDQLDRVALRDQRPLTIHLAKEVLHL
ncbi:MAG: hypothetical protein HQL58_08085 [Magnetococcales bacterium]|nr:hypothetical protein [Magnetococcales bacterium]